MKYLDDLKQNILNKALIDEFPGKETEETKLWVRAIALVRKCDGNYGYAILVRNHTMSYSYQYVNGSTSPVLLVDEIYPYELLNKKYIKGFKGNATAPRVDYLRSLNLPYAEDVKWEEMSFAQLNKEIVGAAVYLQLNNK